MKQHKGGTPWEGKACSCRIVCGYLASLLFLGISLYLAVTYHTSGDLQSFWCYLALAAICLTLDVLVTINLLRTIHGRGKRRRKNS